MNDPDTRPDPLGVAATKRAERALVVLFALVCFIPTWIIGARWSAEAMGKAPVVVREVPKHRPPVLRFSERDGGGLVEAYRVSLQMFERAGYDVAVDAECVSACVLIFAVFPTERVCVTPKARLGMHLVQALTPRGPRPDRKLTTLFMSGLPRWLQEETAKLGPLQLKPKFVEYDALKEHVRTCG